MPLGLKPTCSVCRSTSSSMWKKGGQGEILCNNCTARSAPPPPAAFATTSASAQHSNGGGGGGGGGKQSKQEIHRRSARLRNTKYKSAPAAEKKVSTKGKGRRHIFKLKNPIKAPESVSTIITAESIFYKGVYYQIGDVVSVVDEQDGRTYYAQIRGFIQDQYCEKSAALTWLIPTQASPKDCFDPASYIIDFFFPQDQKKIFQGKWNIWNLFVMHLRNISNLDHLPSLPFLQGQRRAIYGLMWDLLLQSPLKKLLPIIYNFFKGAQRTAEIPGSFWSNSTQLPHKGARRGETTSEERDTKVHQLFNQV